MFNLEGEKWKFVRAKVSPTFSSGKVKYMFSAAMQVADRFVDTFDDIVRTESQRELRDLLGRYTTDVIGTCAFGIECDSLKDPNFIFCQYGRKVAKESNLNPILYFLITMFPNLARRLGLQIIAKDVTEFFIGTVRKTIEYRKKNNVQRNDFMDLLIQINKDGNEAGQHSATTRTLTLEEMAAQAFLFFAAGFETSSTTMIFSLYELSLNQGIQDRGPQEINDVLTKHNNKLTYEAMKEMTYIEMLINETLRKYPPIGALMRKAVRDYPVPNSNLVIKKGDEVLIPSYTIHHDSEIYSDPDIFDPERFAPEAVKKRHPMSFLAFGEGPMNCVGLRFGKMQTRIGLIKLLKHFQFSPCPKTPIPMVFDPYKGVLSPKGGLFLDVKRI
ncbi:probable cytochrome P450 6a21 [Hermetia illucens]|uniref:probable cytochrome P450 6a21 n=1 Tax=Hermetia illucens TaxID=343691 RepID=UPI0018CC1A57|nr:probable cytochrome P450 6a21 [Hermetia illucens]